MYVEIPRDWERLYKWHGPDGIRLCISEAISRYGRPAAVQAEMLDVESATISGFHVPIDKWVAIMKKPIGIDCDPTRKPDPEPTEEASDEVVVVIGGKKRA